MTFNGLNQTLSGLGCLPLACIASATGRSDPAQVHVFLEDHNVTWSDGARQRVFLDAAEAWLDDAGWLFMS